ncbi:hypothetical protein [Magnetospira sp. QH-2]|uniref:hypothetical protein n=1 Tax=Magnetospira sp. (strain QH-2) TaxID=1288970 RepID=UPI0003E81B9D|nr:hypothetical protein [Magnetospira sp. QH-2]CCQ73501.1 Protein of unknown function [Magnetospira sp. QH-2]
MDDQEIERIKARLTALERILRVDAIQHAGDAVDQWWHVVHDGDGAASPAQIEAAGMQAAKEVLATKNRKRRAKRPISTEGHKVPRVK